MLQKLRKLPLAAYMAVTGFFRELKEDENGLSGVVVAVLLILVAVIAVVLIWTLLGEQLAAWWADIVGTGGEIGTYTT